MEKNISADFQYKSKFLDVEGYQMHYIEEGIGEPILFLHGNPTSSYLWRNIIPYLTPYARCIAPDLIGMGKSDKPDLDYRFLTHYRFLSAFIEKMDLRNITLVVHDWGSGLGFHYASLNEQNIKGIAFMEALFQPSKWEDFPNDFKAGFQMMRTPVLGWFLISVLNIFVKQILPSAISRKLTKEEKKYYEEPFPNVESRKAVRQWPCEIPINGEPKDVHRIVENYFMWLQKTQLPKLFFYAKPGGIISQEKADWIQKNIPSTKSIFIGDGIHYLQEDNPHLIGEELQKWYTSDLLSIY